MKVKFINPFLKASVNLFKEYLGIKLTHGAPYLNSEPQDLLEISGSIGLAGETVGAVVLSFDRATAISIVSRFAGEASHYKGPRRVLWRWAAGEAGATTAIKA